MMQPIQVRHLFEGAEDYVMSTCATSNIINNTNNKKKNNNNNNFNNNNYDNNVNVNGDAKNYVRNTELKDFYDVGDFKEKLNGEGWLWWVKRVHMWFNSCLLWDLINSF